MSRKSVISLLIISMVVLLLTAGLIGGGCSKATADITVTSSVTLGHTHQVTISAADISSPPAADKIINTTAANGHYHTITLSPQDYQTLQSGGTVTVTTSVVNDHTHTFTIQKGQSSSGGSGY